MKGNNLEFKMQDRRN